MKKATAVVMAVLCLTILIAVSCSKSSEDKLSMQTPGTCDTANMTYTANVVPILQANCYSCHGNGGEEGGVNLDTYSNVKTEVDKGALPGAITHASGYVPMPYNEPKLSDCDINKILSWINRGALNN